MAKVKICGVTDPEDARYAAAAGAWAVGVNLWPGSRRFVSVERARDIAMALAGAAPLVGVFVDADRAAIERAVGAVPLDMIQLHGDETPDDCVGWAVPVIKAVRLRDRAAWDEAGTFAVDVASGVESAPGRKDREKMKRFIDNALTA